jgi:hypothetical protein
MGAAKPLSDDFKRNVVVPNQNASTDWDTSVNAHQGHYSLYGTYSTDTFSSYCHEQGAIYLARDLDLGLAVSAELDFYEQVDGDAHDDLAVVGSADGGATWQRLASSSPTAPWRARRRPHAAPPAAARPDRLHVPQHLLRLRQRRRRVVR